MDTFPFVGSFFKIVEEDKKKNGSKVKKNILVINSRQLSKLKALETRSLVNWILCRLTERNCMVWRVESHLQAAHSSLQSVIGAWVSSWIGYKFLLRRKSSQVLRSSRVKLYVESLVSFIKHLLCLQQVLASRSELEFTCQSNRWSNRAEPPEDPVLKILSGGKNTPNPDKVNSPLPRCLTLLTIPQFPAWRVWPVGKLSLVTVIKSAYIKLPK